MNDVKSNKQNKVIVGPALFKIYIPSKIIWNKTNFKLRESYGTETVRVIICVTLNKLGIWI